MIDSVKRNGEKFDINGLSEEGLEFILKAFNLVGTQLYRLSQFEAAEFKELSEADDESLAMIGFEPDQASELRMKSQSPEFPEYIQQLKNQMAERSRELLSVVNKFNQAAVGNFNVSDIQFDA